MAVFNNALAGAAGQISEFTLKKSVRLNDDDTAYLSKTFSSSGNRKTYTMSLWVKRGNLGKSYQSLLSNPDSLGYNGVYFDFSSDYLHLADIGSSSWNWIWQSAAVYRDPNAWYHIVAAIDTTQAVAADRIKVYVNGVQVTDFYPGYPQYPTQNFDTNFNNNTFHAIGRLGSIASTAYHYDGYIADFYFIDGQQLDASSFGKFSGTVWGPKAFTGTYGTNGFHLFDFENENLIGADSSGNNNDFTPTNLVGTTLSGSYTANLYTSPTSTYDGTSTATNFSYQTVASSGFDGNLNTQVYSANVGEGWLYFRPSGGISGVTRLRMYADYVQDIYVNGSSAARTSGTGLQWYEITNPPSTLNEIAVQGTSNAVARFAAIEINNAILIEGGSAETDVMVDVPTNGDPSDDTGLGGQLGGNYATLSPLHMHPHNSLGNGNLTITGVSQQYATCIPASMALPSSGKFYCEFTNTGGSTPIEYGIGIADSGRQEFNIAIGAVFGEHGGYYRSNGEIWNTSSTQTGSTYTVDDVVSIAVDMDTGKFWFAKNGTWQLSGNPAAGTNEIGTLSGLVGHWFFGCAVAQTDRGIFNAGQRAFSYAAPSGFKTLCTANSNDTTIKTSGSYTGSSNADGPFVYLNGVPTAMSIGGSAVTFGTDIDKLSNGFKIRSATTNNTSGTSYSYSVTTTGDPFKTSRAQTN